MRWEQFGCEDCGGKGIDLGSLHEPEPCRECQGAGNVLVQTDPLCHGYGNRKPMGQAFTMPRSISAGERAEHNYRFGGGQ